MRNRVIASLGAAAIAGTLLMANAVPVSAQAGSQLQVAGEGGQESAALDPCLPPNPNLASQSATSVLELTGGRAFIRRRPIPVGGRKGTLAFARTELFFGTDRLEGAVTDEEFRGFLDSQITPRFPDGLTVLKGDGQFTDSTGELVKETSFLLILLYPIETFKESSQRIESIRQCYLFQFQQESVLRADNPFASWVSF